MGDRRSRRAVRRAHAAAGHAEDASASGYTTYTVKRGDTLFKIAQRYPGVSAADIKKYNGIGDNIKAGQKIKIPHK